MKPYYEEAGLTIINADCREALASMEPGSIHCVVTSPPYWGLRDYGLEPVVWGGERGCEHEWGLETYKRSQADTASGLDGTPRPGNEYVASLGRPCDLCHAWRGCLGLEPTPDLFVQHIVEVFREVKRVLRDDGTCWINLGDSYAAGGGTQVLQTKNASHGLAGYRHKTPGFKPKDLVGIPWSVAFALRADGWYLRSEIIWAKPNPMPESVTDRPTKAHEQIFLLSKSERYFYDHEAVKEPAAYLQPNSPESIKSPYGQGFTRRAKGNAKTFRGGGSYTNGNSFDNSAEVERESHGNEPNESGLRNLRSVWEVATAPFPEAHFATFPPRLIEPCIKAGCPPGGTVLDPFAGAGTTGLVARKFHNKAVLIEAKAEYCAMIAKRLSQGVLKFA